MDDHEDPLTAPGLTTAHDALSRARVTCALSLGSVTGTALSTHSSVHALSEEDRMHHEYWPTGPGHSVELVFFNPIFHLSSNEYLWAPAPLDDHEWRWATGNCR